MIKKHTQSQAHGFEFEDIVKKINEELKKFLPGKHESAREYGKRKNKHIKENFNSNVILNPKIGNTDNQRRLQCSINSNILNDIIKNKHSIKSINGIIDVDGGKINKIFSPLRFRKTHNSELTMAA